MERLGQSHNRGSAADAEQAPGAEREEPAGRKIAPGAAWVKGAALLGAAAVISKLLGTLQKIPLQNIAGDRAYGIFSAVYPFYTLILFLAMAGFPVAVSAFVAERVSRGDAVNARRVLRTASVLLAAGGAAGFALLYFGADTLAAWMGDVDTAPAIRSISFALLFVPLMSALRGYFQGYHDMMPTAVSQVAEQFVRVGTLVAILLMLPRLGWPDKLVAAGATFGSATGACTGMLVMMLFWLRHRRAEAGKIARIAASAADAGPGPRPDRIRPATGRASAAPEPYRQLAAALMRFALPVCLGAAAVPVIAIVDSFTLPRLFREAGMDGKSALEVFGIYSRGLPLVQLVSMLLGSMTAAIVPAVAEARAAGDMQRVRFRAASAIRITGLAGAAASVGLAVTALPVNVMLFGNSDGTSAIAILAFTALLSTLGLTTAAVLQGLGAPLLPALHLMIAAGVKTALNLALTPALGMNGAALSGVAAYGLAAALNLRAVRRLTGSAMPVLPSAGKTLAALLIMAAAAYGLAAGVPRLLDASGPAERLVHTLAVCLAVPAGAAIYAAALFKLKVVAAADLAGLPGTGRRLLPLLKRLRLTN